jgi:branched-chain amino acid transport system ATP-binding protein
MIRTEDLVAGYGDLEILHGISIEAKPSAITCFIGPNGSGKSTLLSTLFGLVRPWSGRIHLGDSEITQSTPEALLQLGIAYVLQRRSIFPHMSIYENLQMGAYLRNDNLIEKDIERVFEIFPVLKEKARENADSMSGGQQRMLELGRALMINPNVLLLDEPSAGLAPKVIDEIFDVLKRLNEEEDLTLIIVEQNVQRILEFADYGYLLNRGRIELASPCDELLQEDKLIQAYLSY